MNSNTLDLLLSAMLDANMIQYETSEQQKNLALYNKLQSIGLTAEQLDIVSEIVSDQAYADCKAGFHAGFMAALDILGEKERAALNAKNYNPLDPFTTAFGEQ